MNRYRKSTIPNTAKKVFEGIIFDVYQWKQKLFDGHVKTFEMLRRPDTVKVICTIKDKILILKDEQPTRGAVWTLPGGRVEKNDQSPIEAAKREVLEETGYCKPQYISLLLKYIPESKIDWKVYIYIFRDVSLCGKQKLDAGERIDMIKLINFDEFLMLTEHQNIAFGRELLKAMFLARIYKTHYNNLHRAIFGV